MEIIGIICEYNPFHNGHIYHLEQIKKMYPASLIVLVLNGYFLERGEISFLTKEDKTKIALDNGIDIVLELPFVYGTQSADVFANTSILMLNELGCTKIVFGSESNDIQMLKKIAQKQLEDNFKEELDLNLKKGLNYPTALNKTIGIDLSSPNDLLGVSYIKAIMQNKLSIDPILIKRTNDYHDLESNDKIISASNIRSKYLNNEDIAKYTPYSNLMINVNDKMLFNLLKYQILINDNLAKYLDVDEGIEYKLIKEINNVNTLDELILKVKSKRYTYNKIRRMLIHILITLTKEDVNNLKLEYIKLLGFNSKGKDYLSKIKTNIPVIRKIPQDYLPQKYELIASRIYDLLTNQNTYEFEISNKPIKKDM